MIKFEIGLRLEIREPLASFMLKDYDEIHQRAQVVESRLVES